MTLTVNVTGETDSDIVDGLEETLNRVRNGYTSGMDRNETGSFSFTMED